MKLTFAGSGSAFTIGTGNYHSNMVLESDTGAKLLIDCGTDARFSLHELGLNHASIDSVYISHLHADHAGGLEWLAFSTYFDPNCARPKLFISDSIADDLWDKCLEAGLSSIQGAVTTIDTYFDMQRISQNGVFQWEGIEFHTVQTIHIMNGYSIMPSFGLIFTLAGQKVFITTDTQFSPHQLTTFYEQADIIFHDCETTTFKSGVHANFDDLSALSPEFKRKMWLYHYNPVELPDAKGQGFRGFVDRGQCFDFNDPSTL